MWFCIAICSDGTLRFCLRPVPGICAAGAGDSFDQEFSGLSGPGMEHDRAPVPLGISMNFFQMCAVFSFVLKTH